MHILAIDTSGREGSVALARGDANSFELLEMSALAGGMYSAELVPRISDVLSKHNLGKADVDLYAVCSGPGSFTGLRVGLSAVKGLAEILHKPVVSITVLEAICMNARGSSFDQSKSGKLIAALDAQRGEVFMGEYEFKDSLPLRVTETLSSMNDFTVWLSARNPAPPVYTPEAAVEAKVKAAGASVHPIDRPSADSYARIGLLKFLAGQTVSVEELDADYIRRSDAEIFSTQKPR